MEIKPRDSRLAIALWMIIAMAITYYINRIEWGSLTPHHVNNITYIDTIRKRACISDTDTKRVVFRDWSTGTRLDHINMLYKASDHNKDIVMVAYKEAFWSPRYSLTIRWTKWERGMCQVLPLWFKKFPNVFNDKYLTDVNAQIQWCLRLRHRAYEWNNFYQTRSTFRNRRDALRYIEFID